MPQNETWIKFYRKITEHPLYWDKNAYWIFSWLLAHVDYQTGEMIIGRFWLASIFKMNPNTVYAVLKRLQDKYKCITLTSNNRNTTIKVVNWAKYQHQNPADNNKNNNKITTKQQQNNTTQEYKNIRNTNVSTNTTRVVGGADEVLRAFNEIFKTKYTSTAGFAKNFSFWITQYTLDDIRVAIQNAKRDEFWSKRLTPMILFRQKNPQGEPTDLIGDLLNRKSENAGGHVNAKDLVLN